MASDSDNFGILIGPDLPTRRYKPGEVVFREGDKGAELFVIKSGKVEVRTGNRRLETLRENEIFGEMALIDDSPRSATVVALTDVTLAPITESQYLFLVSHTPYFALKVMRVLVHRLRTQNRAVT